MAGAKPSGGQLGPVPSQLSATSHSPAAGRHSPEVRKPSGGQSGLLPSQRSSTSQGPAAGRHSVPASATPSGGQTGLVPSQASGASQALALGRHTKPLSRSRARTHSARPALQSTTPTSQALPVSQGSPQRSQSVPSQTLPSPLAPPSSVPLSAPGLPLSSRPATTHAPLTQRSPAAHSLDVAHTAASAPSSPPPQAMINANQRAPHRMASSCHSAGAARERAGSPPLPRATAAALAVLSWRARR